VAIFDVNLYEPSGWTADTIIVTADSNYWTADGGPLVAASESNDAAINANIISADIYEPVASVWTADSTVVTADSNYWTADGGPLEGARDIADAQVIPAIVEIPGGVYYPRRRPRLVTGYGYGVLPELEGDAIGTVGAIGRALASFPKISSTAAGVIGAVATASGTFKSLSITSKGVVGARAEAVARISLQLDGAAIGRHDDDEAAVMTFLLLAA